jgi:hypothetical protein
MAIKLIANYAKTLGLPGFSSHRFSVSIETELNSNDDIQTETARLYALLQDAVDKEMQEPGFVPDEAYGIDNIRQPNGRQNGNGATSRLTNGHTRNGHSNGHTNGHANGHSNGYSNGHRNQEDAGITERQLELISGIVKENNARKGDVDQLAVDMFGGGIRTLNRMQASNLIDALFERYPRKVNGNHRGNFPAGT